MSTDHFSWFWGPQGLCCRNFVEGGSLFIYCPSSPTYFSCQFQISQIASYISSLSDWWKSSVFHQFPNQMENFSIYCSHPPCKFQIFTHLIWFPFHHIFDYLSYLPLLFLRSYSLTFRSCFFRSSWSSVNISSRWLSWPMREPLLLDLLDFPGSLYSDGYVFIYLFENWICI